MCASGQFAFYLFFFQRFQVFLCISESCHSGLDPGPPENGVDLPNSFFSKGGVNFNENFFLLRGWGVKKIVIFVAA